MNIRRWLMEVVTVFTAALVVASVVSVLWNLIVHRTSVIDWETSVRLAIIFAIILPWMHARRGRER